jgi:tetratricopeptide (TPR) repeat protein
MLRKSKINPHRFFSYALTVCFLFTFCSILLLPSLIFPRLSMSGSRAAAVELPFLERIILQKDTNSLEVKILCNRFSRHRKFELKSPSRIVVDLYNIESIRASRRTQVNDFGITTMRTGQFKSNIARVVFDIKDKMPLYEIKEIQGGVQLSFWLNEEAHRRSEQERVIPAKEIQREEPAIPETSELDSLFNQARTMAFEGNREESINICKTILAEKPDYHDVRIFLGHLYARNQEYDSARKELHLVINAKPDSIYALKELTDVETWSNNLDQALKYSDGALIIDPNNEYFLFGKAQILEKMGNYEEASKAIAKLLETNPSHEEALQLQKRIPESAKRVEPRVERRAESKAPSTDFMIEIKGNYFIPSEKDFKDIYGEGLMYGGEVSAGLAKYFALWFGGNYFSKKGELTQTQEKTKLETYYLGGGIKLRFPLGISHFYLGGGVNFHQYKQSTPIGDVKKGGVGYVGKVGWFIEVVRGLIIDLYGNYTYCEIKPEDLPKINIGGLEAGIGLGFKF